VPPQEDSNLLQMRRCLFFLRSKNLKSTRLKRRGIITCFTNHKTLGSLVSFALLGNLSALSPTRMAMADDNNIGCCCCCGGSGNGSFFLQTTENGDDDDDDNVGYCCCGGSSRFFLRTTKMTTTMLDAAAAAAEVSS